MLSDHPVGYVPAVHALLALVCFHGARFDARIALDGALVMLEGQDRSTWNWSDVSEGMAWLARSAAHSLEHLGRFLSTVVFSVETESTWGLDDAWNRKSSAR